MFTYNIKITGNGTPQEIKEALLDVIGGIEDAEKSEFSTCGLLDGAEWENETLVTEIGQWGSTENAE